MYRICRIFLLKKEYWNLLSLVWETSILPSIAPLPKIPPDRYFKIKHLLLFFKWRHFCLIGWSRQIARNTNKDLFLKTLTPHEIEKILVSIQQVLRFSTSHPCRHPFLLFTYLLRLCRPWEDPMISEQSNLHSFMKCSWVKKIKQWQPWDGYKSVW